MARIEWVAQRLDNWALWRERSGGWSTSSVLANGPVGTDRGAEAHVPCDEVDASITDDAVESLKLGHGHLYETLALYYLRGLGIKGTAERMKRAESTVHANLSQADSRLAEWFEERKRRRSPGAQAQLSVRAQLQAGTAIAIHMAARDERRNAQRQRRRGVPRETGFVGLDGTVSQLVDLGPGAGWLLTSVDVQTAEQQPAEQAAGFGAFLVGQMESLCAALEVPFELLKVEEEAAPVRRRPVLRLVKERRAVLTWPMGSMGEEVADGE